MKHSKRCQFLGQLNAHLYVNANLATYSRIVGYVEHSRQPVRMRSRSVPTCVSRASFREISYRIKCIVHLSGFVTLLKYVSLSDRKMVISCIRCLHVPISIRCFITADLMRHSHIA